MKIQMFHRVAGISKLYPPILGTQHTPARVTKVRKENIAAEKFSILKCPGIFELFSRGFYVSLPYDIEIVAKEEITFKHPSFNPERMPVDVYDETNGWHEQYMSAGIHDEDTISKYFPLRKGAHKSILNLKTGWTVISSVPLLLLPVPYPDRYDFESSIGILDPKQDTNIAAQLCINEEVVNISAGENVIFVVPLTNEKWELDIRELTTKDKLWLTTMHLFKSGWSKMQKGGFFRFSTCPFSIKQEKFKLFTKFWK